MDLWEHIKTLAHQGAWTELYCTALDWGADPGTAADGADAAILDFTAKTMRDDTFGGTEMWTTDDDDSSAA